MPKAAKVYIALVIASGTTVLLFAAGSWTSASLGQFAIYLGLAALASTLKVRVPRLECTMSPNFVFLLLGMTACRFSEVVAIAFTAALVQLLWAAKQPRLIQVAFSSAALVLSSCVAYEASKFLLSGSALQPPVALVLLAGALYLPLNTALIAAVIGLVDGKSVAQVARTCYEYVFPYFVGGIVFAGLVSGAFARAMVWKGAIILLPITVLAYLYSMSRRSTPPQHLVHSSPVEDEELVGCT